MTTNGQVKGKSSENGLGCLIMTALVNRGFRRRLLREPAEAAADFELTPDERAAVISIRADSLPEFAGHLHRWLEQRNPLCLDLASSDERAVETNGRRDGEAKALSWQMGGSSTNGTSKIA